ncbi:conserved oligomeric Golgi complex subunit 1 isoform X2 [Drosophila busckii]|uniref:conserved oligomeric Golgi complex subunit 1 isoform X2 n=1 Tax=Drosophila busckii TaxID=30019 RepID=UPI00083F1FAD|nr:conserved oligomeric Golgi complex subunit 1 isoform X2 [Drosophila busckii]XP_017849288.1 conserved oligomeric Golgi complex subunit 1 isoform X2 [Drosophila busckii]
MSANLLELNVDTLFEQHSVSEIDAVQKKIQMVVENKREELRTMVGERYRDLLKAADTIAAMQSSAGTLIEQVHCIQSNCRSLNEQQLLGFKTTPVACEADILLQQRTASKQLNNYYSTMVQIKLLTSLPELIWTHIDQEQFYAATELFIFSRHISTGLQLDAKNALMQRLPVAHKQWEILRPFHLTIKHAVLNVLEREQLSAEVAVDCMQSLLLLEKCDLHHVLQTFLQLRATAFVRCLQSQSSDAEAKKSRRVKERILASLHILNGTIELMDKCLLSNGLLFERIEQCSAATTPPSISRMDISERQLAHLLPDIIANYRPQFDKPQLAAQQISDALLAWLRKIDTLAAKELEQIFSLVSSMQTIQDIKSAAAATAQSSYAELEQQLQLKSTQLNFYKHKYVPLINARVREIIRSSWAAAMQHTYELVVQLVQSSHSQEPAPLQIWREQNEDLPLSLAAALSEQPKRLANRTKGYSTATIELCAEFDKQLAQIVQELNVLLQEQSTRAEHKLALINFLRETAQQQMMDYVSKLKTLQLQERQALLQALRCTLALIELCPSLKLCFCQPSSWRQWAGNLTAAGAEHWQRLCALIEEEMLRLWLLIVDDVLSTHNCDDKLPKGITHNMVLQDFALWHTQTLEQQDEEQQQSVQSSIRIPSQPRLSLQTYLHQLIQALNVAVPQTLPSKVLHAFNQKLLTQLLAHYELLAAADCTKSSQNIALQLYFDLKFLERVFSVTREERQLYEQFHALQRRLRDFIDPFDFELFAEHINQHVARSAARLHGELGVLTAMPANLPGGVANATLAHEADPNVLCLSSSGSTSLWFPLLPIVTAQSTPLHSERKSLTTASEKAFFEL